MIDLIYSIIKGEAKVGDDPLLHELQIAKIIKEKKGFYKLQDGFRIGKVDIASSGIGYLETYGSKTYKKDLLIEQNDLNHAQKGDIVVAKRLFSKSQRPRAKVVKILKHAFLYSIVYTQKINRYIVGINIKNGLHVNIAASQKSLKSLPEQTVLKINNQTSAIEEVLGVLSDESVDEKISLAIYAKKDEFSKLALREAKSYGKSVEKNMYEDYEDFTNLPFCTIDPVDAKDFDDAVYFDEKNHVIYVAIADVSSYVHPYSAMDKEARGRGFSIYFPHKSIPMLPRNLSENICSLKPNEDRLAFCFKITIDKDSLKPKKEELLNVVINSKRRFNYDEIDEYLNGKEPQNRVDREILSWLMPLNKFTCKLRKKRLLNAFEFRSDEVRMNVDENQRLVSTTIEKETPSHQLIEDCMLLANKAAAKLIEKGVFRNHESPSFEKIEHLLEDLSMIGLDFKFHPELPKLIKSIQKRADEIDLRTEVDKLIIKSQKKAKYESLNKGHFGLGFDKYTHFTSPIRRYSDLVLHRLLKAKLKNDKKLFSYQLENIDELCENLNILERESDRVAYDYMDRKFARYFSERIGEEFEAIITSVGNKLIAKLDDEIKGARVFLVDHDAFLLDRVVIKILSADIAQTTITAKIVKVLG